MGVVAPSLTLAEQKLVLPLATFGGSSWWKAQEAELVLGTVWYCAEGKVKTVNNPPSANH